MSHPCESDSTPRLRICTDILETDTPKAPPCAVGKNLRTTLLDKLHRDNLDSGYDEANEAIVNVNDENVRNLSEIEQLRFRISQLEHLITMPPAIQHTTSTNTYNYASILVHPTPASASGPLQSTMMGNMSGNALLPSPDTSALLIGQEAVAILHRTSQLESLLAASELDNRNMKQQLQLLHASKNRQRMELKEDLKRKDLEIRTIKENLRLTEMKEAKNAKKSAAIENYINTLPSEDELNHLQAKVDTLTSENEFLHNRLEGVKTELSKTQREYMQKERELQDALIRLQDLKPLEEAQASLLKEDKDSTYFSNEENVRKVVTLQKAQLIQFKKIIKALRAKLLTRDLEKNEMILTFADKVRCIGNLEERLACLRIENENIREREQRCVAAKNALGKECEDLKAVIEKMESSNDSRRQQMIKVVHLTTQVELCCVEVRQLVQLCQSICNGEEPSIEDLVGFNSLEPEEEDARKAKEDEDDSDKLNLEWIVQKIVDICKVRKDVQDLRTKINDLYTDTLAQDVEKCNVQ